MTNHAAKVSRRAALGGLMAFGAAGSAHAQMSLDLGGLMRTAKAASLGEKDEIEFGRKLYGPALEEMGGAYRNPAVQQAVTRIATPIFATSKRKAFTWEVKVCDSNEVNAWSLPGGKVGINKGLLRYVDSEDELAAVIAHEMGHAEFSHAIKEMRKKALTAVAATAASAAASDDDHGGVSVGRVAGLGALDLGIIQMAGQGYARDSEREADQHIATVFAATGYDVGRGAQFYRALLDLIPEDAKGRTSLFSGHPDTEKRLRDLMAQAQGAPAAPRDSEAFAAVKTAFPTRHIWRPRAA